MVSYQDHLENKYSKLATELTWNEYVCNELGVSKWVKEICFKGIRGAKVTENYNLPAPMLVHGQFHIGILDIGSNDVTMSKLSEERITWHIMAEAEAMRDLFHIPVVKVCSIIHRDNAGDLSPSEFRVKAHEVNRRLQTECAARPRISYHGHEGFWRDKHGQQLADTYAHSYDGIHPNTPLGRQLYRASLTRAIHNAKRELAQL